MALTDSEVQRLRFELGFPNLDTAAEPYVGIAAVFSQVIQPYTLGGASTTSSTTVAATTTPTPTTLTLASASGLAVGNVVVVDVDTRQERATIQALSGSTITVQLSLDHVGSYPVVVEGGESILREILGHLRECATTISALRTRAGLKSIDGGDVVFFGGGRTLAADGLDPMTQALRLREHWRDELAQALGLERTNRAHGGTVGVY